MSWALIVCPKREHLGGDGRSNSMRTPFDPDDLTDAQWAIIEPLIPPAMPGGRHRTTDMRAGVDAIFYILSSGCQWR